MNHTLLQFLDYFFIVFHLLFLLFNLVGWMFKRTRIIHIGTISLTLFSWIVLGFWFGFGYCFCTDWHWTVRELLNKPILTNSYVDWLLQSFLGINLEENIINLLVVLVTIATLGLSISLTIIDKKNRKRRKRFTGHGA